MEYWEFLIQKEGDRSWLPLESPDVEILEGRYRVVARSSRANTTVEIRIGHQLTDVLPPKRRVQKRIAKTNRDGLVVVIPYTRLLPGIWELRCQGDLMSDMMGDGWQYAIQLQVLPQDAESEEWDPDWQEVTEVAEWNDAVLSEAAQPTCSKAEQSVTAPAALDFQAPNGVAASANDLEKAETASPQPVSSQGMSEGAHPGEAANVETPHRPAELVEPPAPIEAIAAEAEAVVDESVAAFSAELSEDAEPISQDFEQLDAAAAPESDSSPAVSLPESETAGQAPPLPDDATPAAEVNRPALDARELEVSATSSQLFDVADQMSELFRVAEQMTDQVIESLFQKFNPDGEADPRTVEAPPERQPAQVEPSSSSLQLTLDRDNYIIRRGQELAVTGQIEASTPENQQISSHWLGELHIHLYDPQTAEVLLDLRHPLLKADQANSEQAIALPLPFACGVKVPVRHQTHLVLGEITLYGATTATGEPTAFATQSFSVATNLEDLLEAVANDFSESEENFPGDLATPLLGRQPAPPDLNLTFLNLLSSAQPAVQFQTSDKTALPPQLYRSDPEQMSLKQIDLPFSKPNSTPDAAEAQPTVAETSDAATEPASASDSDAHPPSEMFSPDEFKDAETSVSAPGNAEAGKAEVAADIADPLAKSDADTQEGLVDSPFAWDRVLADEDTDFQGDTAVEASISPEDYAFQLLKLQDRFWSRLNALASDEELASLLRSPLSPPGTDALNAGALEVIPPDFAGDEGVDLDAALTQQEFVIEEETPSKSSRPRRLYSSSSPQSEVSSEEKLHDLELSEEPLPTPTLKVSPPELVAGQPLQVSAKLPHLSPRLYVKLWIRDLQTRSLLDGPRWLVDFIPDGYGGLEARTELVTPFGCLEIEIEAIAVEMATQRESHKVTVEREVVPPDLPPLPSEDDLDIYGIGGF